jgi:NAD(P)-dependent dehydrogenase (short-subunit alcohol dehydrogenase family)
MNILITGISKGLGLELANWYAAEGHDVYGISRSKPEKLACNVRWQSGDVTNPSCQSVIQGLISGVPYLDLLINNAGCGSSGSQLAAVEPAELTAQLALHCNAPLMITQAVIAKLHRANLPKIVNVTSRLGSIARHQRGDFANRSFSYCYRIAKAAQNMLTICMQGDESLNGIVIAAINPGLLRTDSGSRDAKHSARDGATAFMRKVEDVNESGSYHAFDEDATI